MRDFLCEACGEVFTHYSELVEHQKLHDYEQGI